MDFSNHTVKLWNMQAKNDGSLDSKTPFNTSASGVASQVPVLPARPIILGAIEAFLASQNTEANSPTAIWASSQVADGNGSGTFADPYSLRGAVYNATLGSEVILKDDGVYQTTNPLDVKSDASDSTPEDFAGGSTGGTVWGDANPKIVTMSIQKPTQESERITIRGEQGTLPVIDCQEMHFIHIEDCPYLTFFGLKFINTQTVFFINPASQYWKINRCAFYMTLGGDNKSPIKHSGRSSDFGEVDRCYMEGPGLSSEGVHANTCGIYTRLSNNITFKNCTIHNFPLGFYFKHPNNPLDGTGNTGLLENLHIYNCDRAGGIDFAGSNYTLRNNLMLGGRWSAAGGAGADGVTYGGRNLVFENNTFLGTGNEDFNFSASQGEGGENSTATNNIFAGRYNGVPYKATPVFGATNDYNLFANGFYINQVARTLAQWQSDSGQDANSVAEATSFVGSDETKPLDWAVADGGAKNGGSDGNDMGCDVTKVGLFGAVA